MTTESFLRILFKSLGLVVEDLASAEFLLAEASARKVGTWVEL